EVRREGVETARRRRDDDGHAALERAPADRIAALGDDDGFGLSERGEAEALAENPGGEALGERARVGASLDAGHELGPVRLGDAPVAADLVAELEALRDAVVGFRLMARRELRDLREPLGRD